LQFSSLSTPVIPLPGKNKCHENPVFPVNHSCNNKLSCKGEQELEGATTVLYNVDKDGDQIPHEDQTQKEDKLPTKRARRLPTTRQTDFYGWTST
jgi:hypothetical protein